MDLKRLLGTSFPFTVCAKRHFERGITVRGASRESRTVSVLRRVVGVGHRIFRAADAPCNKVAQRDFIRRMKNGQVAARRAR